MLGPNASPGDIESLFWARCAPGHRLYRQRASLQASADVFIDSECPAQREAPQPEVVRG